MIKINLLPVEKRPQRFSVTQWQRPIVVVGLLILLANTGYGVYLQVTARAYQSRYEEMQQTTRSLQQQRQVVTQLEQEVQALDRSLADYRELVTRSTNPAATLHATNQGIPDEVWLEQVVWSNGSLRLVGYTTSLAQLSLLVRHLNEQGLGPTVEFDARESVPLVTFTISGQGS